MVVKSCSNRQQTSFLRARVHRRRVTLLALHYMCRVIPRAMSANKAAEPEAIASKLTPLSSHFVLFLTKRGPRVVRLINLSHKLKTLAEHRKICQKKTNSIT